MLSPGLDTACITVSWNGLSGTVTGIHIHDGMPGQDGSVLNDLDAFVSGNRVATMYTGASLTKQWKGKLFSSQLYINIHTAANAGGEISGQVWLGSGCYAATAGIENMFYNTTNTNISVYPNPANDIVNLVLLEGVSKGTTSV